MMPRELHTIYTLSSLQRTIYVYNDEAPVNYLDLHLASCYQHNIELFPDRTDICRQIETIATPTWRNLNKEKKAKTKLKPQIIFGGVKCRPSIHSVKLGIGGNHIAQTNAGFSRKLDGSYYSV